MTEGMREGGNWDGGELNEGSGTERIWEGYGREGIRDGGTEGNSPSHSSLSPLTTVRISRSTASSVAHFFSLTYMCINRYDHLRLLHVRLRSYPRLSHQLKKNSALLHKQGEISLLSTRPRSNMKIIHVPTIVTDPLQSPSPRLTYSEVTDENSR